MTKHPHRRRPGGSAGQARAVTHIMVPRTGLAGTVRRDQAVADMLAAEAARLAAKTPYAAPAEHGRARRAGEAALLGVLDMLDGMSGGVIDLSGHVRPLPAPRRPGVWARYWAWNRRAFEWLAGHLRQLLLGAWLLVLAVLYVLDLYVSVDYQPVWIACYAWAAMLGVWLSRNLSVQRSELEAITSQVNTFTTALAAEDDTFSWRDVPVEPFAPVCRCPNCDELGLHWLAAPHRVPAYEPDEVPHDPVVWRECGEIGCAFVWAQIR